MNRNTTSHSDFGQAHGSIQFDFNITPHGILARIPLVQLNGHTFADLSWSEYDSSLLLLLKLRVPRYIGDLSLYDVGVFSPRHRWDKAPTRLSRIHPKEPREDGSLHKTCAPSVLTWKLIYLQTHSYTEPETPVYLPVNHAFPPLLRLPEHLIAEFLRHEKQRRISNSQLPWSGNPPLRITFLYDNGFDSLYVAVQFGCCDSGTRPGIDRASFWANIRGSTTTSDCGDGDHECPADHILTWPRFERKFVLVTHHVKGSFLGERDVKWILKMSFTQSPTGTGPLTLTHISIDNHTLMENDGYRDWLDEFEIEKQELKRKAQSATLAGKDHDHPGRVREEQKGQGVVADTTVPEAFPDSQVHSIQARTTLDASERLKHVIFPPHHRIIRFLAGALKLPSTYSCVLPACIFPLQEDCFLPPLGPYLYDFPVMKPTALSMRNQHCHA